MPTYDYQCGACGHAFEHFQSISDKLLRTCPECGKRRLERLFGTGIGVVFKGSGFYETDYKRKPADGEGSETTPRSDAPAERAGGGKAGQDDPTPASADGPGGGDAATSSGATGSTGSPEKKRASAPADQGDTRSRGRAARSTPKGAGSRGGGNGSDGSKGRRAKGRGKRG